METIHSKAKSPARPSPVRWRHPKGARPHPTVPTLIPQRIPVPPLFTPTRVSHRSASNEQSASGADDVPPRLPNQTPCVSPWTSDAILIDSRLLLDPESPASLGHHRTCRARLATPHCHASLHCGIWLYEIKDGLRPRVGWAGTHGDPRASASASAHPHESPPSQTPTRVAPTAAEGLAGRRGQPSYSYVLGGLSP